MTKDAIPCSGRGCIHRSECGLYDKGAADVHGWMDMDEGWTCPEWVRKDAPVVETEDDQKQLF